MIKSKLFTCKMGVTSVAILQTTWPEARRTLTHKCVDLTSSGCPDMSPKICEEGVASQASVARHRTTAYMAVTVFQLVS